MTLRRAPSAAATAVVIALALVATLGITATPAAAHSTGAASSEGTDYQYRLDSFDPGIDGIELSMIAATNQVKLVNHSPVEVTVIGYSGEPYLRIGPDGIFENRRSPATYLNADESGTTATPATADPDAAPEWVEVSDSNQAAWHDHRAHWMAGEPTVVRDEPDRVHELAQWTIPFEIDGRAVDATGTTLWVPPPDSWPWWTAAAVIGVLAVGACALRSWRIPVAVVASVLVAACIVDLVGGWWASPDGINEKLGSISLPMLAVAFVVAGLVSLPHHPRDGTILLACGSIALAVMFGYMSRSYLDSSQLPTELPVALARTTVVVAVGAGIGLALCPVVRWLRTDGARRPAAAGRTGRVDGA